VFLNWGVFQCVYYGRVTHTATTN